MTQYVPVHIKTNTNKCSPSKDSEQPDNQTQSELYSSHSAQQGVKERKTTKIRNQYDQVPHLTQDTKWKSGKITIRHHKEEPRGQVTTRQ